MPPVIYARHSEKNKVIAGQLNARKIREQQGKCAENKGTAG